jgi:hypothetical protein
MLAYILELWIHKSQREKSSKILQEIPHTWGGALSATRIGLWLGKQVGEVGRLSLVSQPIQCQPLDAGSKW